MCNKNKIIFFGNPHFAAEVLNYLLEQKFNIVAVVCSPDKQVGRGLKIHYSDVKTLALERNLKILQPENFNNDDFISEIKQIKPDLQIVVAFRKLPQIVWEIPKYGTINLHASILPKYRGAAPINWSIINGDIDTGLTTFFINNKIDCGDIIEICKFPIPFNENYENIYKKMLIEGVILLNNTINKILNNTINKVSQEKTITTYANINKAPKFNKESNKIRWNGYTIDIYNFIKGFSPYPAAYTELISPEGKVLTIKIFNTIPQIIKHNIGSGQIFSDKKNIFKISTIDGFLYIKELQLAGKKRINVVEFLKGHKINTSWKLCL